MTDDEVVAVAAKVVSRRVHRDAAEPCHGCQAEARAVVNALRGIGMTFPDEGAPTGGSTQWR